MKKQLFDDFIRSHSQLIEKIRNAAATLHEEVRQTYDGHPYIYHLSMVADAAMRYGYEVIDNESDVIPVIFAASFTVAASPTDKSRFASATFKNTSGSALASTM